MSVTVEHLTKRYGNQLALDDVSFSASRGEILGFLGPNGAGKTTTMKILTGFVSATAGQASVNGFDVRTESKAVRQSVGYLPEHNPLYLDMYVQEYLRFVAGLNGMKKPQKQVDSLIERTGLGREQHKQIGALSKGYRQRVGLAQAMLHDPEVLILDEPTSGLDPNQLVDIRKLIKDLGAEKTVIFSTHIMQEVQALCDRVLIIDQGNLVANDTMSELQSRLAGEKRVTIGLIGAEKPEFLMRLDGVKRLQATNTNQWQVYTDHKVDLRADIFRACVENNRVLIELHQESVSVEDIFQKLTGSSDSSSKGDRQ
ncbi:MAG: gliding motility-associated ABC transporter ATP-binding subunit GldA [Saprospiraceae bacterium]|nr:gliding motility-associated ABC transporter ATP-binding subunit GldA [Saprospiraceae bacterium]